MLDFKKFGSDEAKAAAKTALEVKVPEVKVPEVKVPEETLIHDLDCFFNEPQADPEVMKTLVTAAKAYGIKKDKLKIDESSIKQRKSKLREEELILFDMFQAVGIASIKAEGRTYFTRVDTYASVDAGNKETAFKWIKEIGCGYLIVKTVNAQSLTREVKAYIEAEDDTPGQEQGIKLRTENRVSAPKG